MVSLRAMTAAQLRFVIAVVALATVWLIMLLFGGGTQDRAVAQALYAGGSPALVVVARAFTALGEPTFLVASGFVVAAWLWWCGRGRFAVGLLLVILVGRALTELQKYWIARARPDLETHLVLVKTSSFPSGHSTASMIFYLTLALALFGRTRWRRVTAATAILLSLLIGVSRVMLGVHWPSDVIGGWSFGLFWVLVILRPAQRLFGKDSPANPKQL
jgi:membrane-associated phospholipid phosphatase